MSDVEPAKAAAVEILCYGKVLCVALRRRAICVGKSVVPGLIRISGGRQPLAFLYLVLHAVWSEELMHTAVVPAFVKGLYTVCVVPRKVDVTSSLVFVVDTTVYDAEGIQVQVVRARARDRAVGYEFVLALEIRHEPGAVLAAVGFSPKADSLVVRLVTGKFLKPGLSKVP